MITQPDFRRRADLPVDSFLDDFSPGHDSCLPQEVFLGWGHAVPSALYPGSLIGLRPPDPPALLVSPCQPRRLAEKRMTKQFDARICPRIDYFGTGRGDRTPETECFRLSPTVLAILQRGRAAFKHLWRNVCLCFSTPRRTYSGEFIQLGCETYRDFVKVGPARAALRDADAGVGGAAGALERGRGIVALILKSRPHRQLATYSL